TAATAATLPPLPRISPSDDPNRQAVPRTSEPVDVALGSGRSGCRAVLLSPHPSRVCRVHCRHCRVHHFRSLPSAYLPTQQRDESSTAAPGKMARELPLSYCMRWPGLTGGLADWPGAKLHASWPGIKSIRTVPVGVGAAHVAPLMRGDLAGPQMKQSGATSTRSNWTTVLFSPARLSSRIGDKKTWGSFAS
ncbi:hypothetical protein THAOC_09352, partial [Thalassiosira oceanica]